MIHYSDGMIMKEISKLENAVIRVVSRSIRKAEEKIAKYFFEEFLIKGSKITVQCPSK